MLTLDVLNDLYPVDFLKRRLTVTPMAENNRGITADMLQN